MSNETRGGDFSILFTPLLLLPLTNTNYYSYVAHRRWVGGCLVGWLVGVIHGSTGGCK